jgi:hypothetical protein
MEKELIKIDTELVCKELEELMSSAHKEFNEPDTEIKVLRYIYDGQHVYIEANQDYLFRPNESWKLITVLNKELINIIIERNDLDKFIKSKVLQWVASCVSKTFCKLEFYKTVAFDEDNFTKFIKDMKAPKIIV